MPGDHSDDAFVRIFDDADAPLDDERVDGAAFVDRALSDVGAAAASDRYLACVRAVAADDCDPAWLPWLVGDALARTVRTGDSPFGDRDAQVDVVARVAALAVHRRWRRLDALDVAGDDQFERIVAGLRTVESDDRQFFERVVRQTATLLDEEYVSGLAALDWQDAFDTA